MRPFRQPTPPLPLRLLALMLCVLLGPAAPITASARYACHLPCCQPRLAVAPSHHAGPDTSSSRAETSSRSSCCASSSHGSLAIPAASFSGHSFAPSSKPASPALPASRCPLPGCCRDNLPESLPSTTSSAPIIQANRMPHSAAAPSASALFTRLAVFEAPRPSHPVRAGVSPPLFLINSLFLI